jgi:hypothetical protein
MKLQTYTNIISSLFKGAASFNRKIKERRPMPKAVDPKDEIEIEEEIQKAKVEEKRVWHDIRKEPRTKDRGKSKGTRDWNKITGITLHQTACQFGTNPMRLLNVPTHSATLVDGSIVLMHDPPAYMHHAGKLNRTDIGIEVSCSAPGVVGVAETFWLPKKYKHLKGEERLAKSSPPTVAQLEATKELVKYYVDLVAENGGKIKYIHAHRQSSKSRIGDPGEQIWKAVANWAVEELGLDPHYNWDKGGNALPDVWTGKANGVRYSSKVDGRLEK